MYFYKNVLFDILKIGTLIDFVSLWHYIFCLGSDVHVYEFRTTFKSILKEITVLMSI